jgi:hypothetical protein
MRFKSDGRPQGWLRRAGIIKNATIWGGPVDSGVGSAIPAPRKSLGECWKSAEALAGLGDELNQELALHSTSVHHVPPFATEQTGQAQQPEKTPVIEAIIGVGCGHGLIPRGLRGARDSNATYSQEHSDDHNPFDAKHRNLLQQFSCDPVGRRLLSTRTRARTPMPGEMLHGVGNEGCGRCHRKENAASGVAAMGAELPIPDGSGGLSRAGSSAPAHDTAVYLRQETLG